MQVIIYSLARYLAQPLPALHLLFGLALIGLWRHRSKPARWPLRLATSCYLLLTLLTLPIVSFLLTATLERRYAPLEKRPPDVQAIVVLGGGTLPPNKFKLHAELDPAGLYRCLKAYQMYCSGEPCPIYAVGGKFDPTTPGPASAELMKQLLMNLGVSAKDILTDTRSRTTLENAVECKKLLVHDKITHVLLVTDAIHLRRAELCFRKQGIQVTSCGCQFRATEFNPTVFWFLPHFGAGSQCHDVAHEWLGLLWYKIHGRI